MGRQVAGEGRLPLEPWLHFPPPPLLPSRTRAHPSPTSQNNVASFDGHEGSVGCLSFSENGYYLATGDAREVKLWDLRKLKTFKSIAAPAAVADVAFDHSGLFLAVGAGDEATVHETKTWAQLTKLDVSATGVAFGPKAKQLAVSTADGKLQIYGGA